MQRSVDKQLLVVVAKAPRPGDVKTRLHGKLTPAEATELYSCFLRDRIQEISGLHHMDLAIAYTPADSKNYFVQFLSNGFQVFSQQGKDLGERLHHIFMQKLNQGYRAVTIVDSDTPDLPKSIVSRACRLLSSDAVDAVFGPCEDGGYYLVGLREPRGELFTGIPWSTAGVLPLTLEKAAAMGLRHELLPQWNDLDTFEDLLAFYHRYKRAPLREALVAKCTMDYLSRLPITGR